MEKELKYEIEQAVTALAGSIYPTNAPETNTKPCLVYMRTSTELLKAFDGQTGKQKASYMLSVMAPKYSDMKSLTNSVVAELLTFTGTSIGASDTVYIEDLTINNVSETYEFEMMVNRGIIDFTVFY